jgi:hypothetical protein
MNISADDLQYCLAQADMLAHHYGLMARDASNPVRDIGEILRTCEHALQAQVSVFQMPEEEGEAKPWVLGACVLFKNKKYDVIIAKQNECWSRFVLCKELFHIALDRAEYRNMSMDGHIEEIMLAFPDDDSEPRKPVVAEFLAEVGAMELLFPYSARAKILAANPRPDFLAIAKQHMVPKAYTEKYLGTAYMKILGRFSRV